MSIQKIFTPVRYMKTRPRLLIAAAVGGLLLVLLPDDWQRTTRLLLAWDAATGLYLLLVASMMMRSTTDKIRRRAALQDEGRMAILALTTLGALASLAAIIAELATAKALSGHAEGQHIALAALTVFLSWSFMQTMFALHYAHEYYMERDGAPAEGLEFPGQNHKPDYWDFVYYAFVIGTSTATADINITSGVMRRTTALHCVVAFFFNTTILALTVNIGAGLF